MLLIALGGQRVARRMRAQSQNFRRAMGVLLAGAALAIVFNTSQSLQTALGGYTTSIQKHVEETSLAQKHLDSLRGGGNAFAAAATKAKRERRTSLAGPRHGARLHRHRRLAEHAGRPAGVARRAARQGRARRLLDVLVHQLPAHASAPARLVRRVPQGRPRDRRRAHAGVRVRARARQRPPGDARPRRHLARRARQRLRHVDGVLEPVLARRVPDRQDRASVRHVHFGEGDYGGTRAGDPLAARRSGRVVAAGAAPPASPTRRRRSS